MLKVENLVKKYKEKTVVNDLSFELNSGEMIGLLGVNGAGKTTTFRMILNIIKQDSGTVTLDGEPITLDTTDAIGYLAEERSLLLKMNVIEQVKFFARLKGMKNNEIESAIDEWFAFFEMDHYRKNLVKELSKGNQQKVQFICSVIHKPKLIILDEPFSGLDPININLFRDAMNKLIADGAAIIFSSHRMDHVEFFCENVIVMYNGTPIIHDTVTNLKANYDIKKVHLEGNINLENALKIPGIISHQQIGDEYIFEVSDEEVAHQILASIDDLASIKKFVIVYPTLEEIFINAIKEARNV